MGELYDTAAAHKSTIVGGEDPDVGIGGYFTGGGHSLISAHYGLAADNILEFQVVTPSGSIEMLNECSNTDLFFAFRGVSRQSLEAKLLYFSTETLAGWRLDLRRHHIRNIQSIPDTIDGLVALHRHTIRCEHLIVLASGCILPFTTTGSREKQDDGLLQH